MAESSFVLKDWTKRGVTIKLSLQEGRQKEIWTVEYIVDRLFFEMLELNDNADADGWEDYQKNRQKEKYYNRAKEVLKMAAGLPSPIFVINKSDLTLRLKRELAGIKKGDALDYVVTEAIGRVCENQNAKLYHLTLKKCLGWRFDN
jgi:hypothetical protein